MPYAKGQEVSYPFEEIVCRVKELVDQSWSEVVLLGQNVNSYGQDFSDQKRKKLRQKFGDANQTNWPLFPLLLQRLHQIKDLQKISFLTSNPWDFSDQLIEVLALPKIDRQLHLPVQSGDDEVLKKMNRPYTALQYIKLVEKIKKKVPNIRISTDLIVGFPGETKEAFTQTVKLCRQIGFNQAFIAKYSPRPGTAAFRLKDDVSPQEKKRRWRVLEELINQS